MVTYTPANTGEGMVFSKQLNSFLVFTFIDQGHIPLNADMSRAGRLAWRRSSLADGVSARNGLSILFINGFAISQSLVIVIRYIYGTYFGALTAAGAFVQINEARFPGYLGGELSGFTCQ
jgi:hypothetical protein